MAVAGWYADPYGAQGQLRYWDGAQWTANVMPRPSSAPMQGAGPSGPVGAQAQAQAAQAQAAQAQAQAAQMQARTVHESVPLGASSTAAPTSGAYGYQGQAADQQYAAQAAQGQVNYAQMSNAYEAATQGYTQAANAYESAAQGYAQAASAYDAAAQGYAQVGQYDAAQGAQGYGQYDPNAQAYGQAAASPYYQGYDPYQQMDVSQPVQAPEGSNRTLRLIAFILYIVAILGVVALVVVVALAFFGVLNMGYSYSSGFSLFAAETPLVFLVALPLAWLIPMCIHTLGILKGTKRNTVLFGVLTLLFCGLLPGIFLLIAKKDPKPAETFAQQPMQQTTQLPMG